MISLFRCPRCLRAPPGGVRVTTHAATLAFSSAIRAATSATQVSQMRTPRPLAITMLLVRWLAAQRAALAFRLGRRSCWQARPLPPHIFTLIELLRLAREWHGAALVRPTDLTELRQSRHLILAP